MSLITPTLAADPNQGRQLALRWCAGCHQVTHEQRRPAVKALAFAEIPRRTALDEVRLALYLVIEKNRGMIGRKITPGEASDIAAYIVTQMK